MCRLSPPLSARPNSVSDFLFPDVKFQTQFPLPPWSVCGDESRAAAICINFHSVLSYVSPMNRDSLQHRLREKPAVCSLFYLHVIAGFFSNDQFQILGNSGDFHLFTSKGNHWLLIYMDFFFPYSVALYLDFWFAAHVSSQHFCCFASTVFLIKTSYGLIPDLWFIKWMRVNNICGNGSICIILSVCKVQVLCMSFGLYVIDHDKVVHDFCWSEGKKEPHISKAQLQNVACFCNPVWYQVIQSWATNRLQKALFYEIQSLSEVFIGLLEQNQDQTALYRRKNTVQRRVNIFNIILHFEHLMEQCVIHYQKMEKGNLPRCGCPPKLKRQRQDVFGLFLIKVSPKRAMVTLEELQSIESNG